ncbi:MAG: type I methionyl aminopeptidase [Fimbriimonadaceae bacterium]|nr:type I methionyl aminopeptidase [Fimbriimonadaceae bacterium]
MIYLKKGFEIAKMRAAGRIVAKTIRELSEAIVPGKTTPRQLDELAGKIVAAEGGVCAFNGYRGYPANACISVNQVVIHGIPNDVPLQEGDIVDLDLGVTLDGWNADGAWTYPVGNIDPDMQKLLNVTKESLYQGIAKAKVGNKIGDISAAIEKYVNQYRYGIVRDLVGHGIGRTIHEEPSVPNFGKAGRGPVIKEGMTFCIEPMVNKGTWKVRTLSDGWTIVTADNSWSAHFEHTVAVTKDGPEILTVE